MVRIAGVAQHTQVTPPLHLLNTGRQLLSICVFVSLSRTTQSLSHTFAEPHERAPALFCVADGAPISVRMRTRGEFRLMEEAASAPFSLLPCSVLLLAAAAAALRARGDACDSPCCGA